LANDGDFVALKRADETERDGDTEKGCQKPAVQQKTGDEARHTEMAEADVTTLEV